MTEQDFTDSLVAQLARFVAPCAIATKKNVLYSLSVDERGNLQPSMNPLGEPIRGDGSGFEQDILVFDRVSSAFTSVVPRVISEVKLGGVTTHDVLVYAEKARRIRTVYPYVRYGLLLGAMPSIPPRVLRLGQEFDFISALSYPTQPEEIEVLGALFQQEIKTSQELAAILRGAVKVKQIHRVLKMERR